jgi:dihydroneopterin aldolase/2-amino-4-hydroxy-6-hydroxymethyldihydropteridine diphosphokinase/dihydropteroate synthase
LVQLISAVQPPRDEDVPSHMVAIAFGSNLGDRFANIELALRLLESPSDFLDTSHDILNQKDAEIAIIDTSFLYETAPMYVTGQPSFVNGACLVCTSFVSSRTMIVYHAFVPGSNEFAPNHPPSGVEED